MTTINELPMNSGFLSLLEPRLISAENGTSEIELPLRGELLNGWGVVHGGVTMSLCDMALAFAARTLAEPNAGLVTVEMKVSFMQPGQGLLRAHGRVLHRSTTMAYCEGEVRDEEGHFVAKALGTFKYVGKLTIGRRVLERQFEPAADA
ncbi:MAG: PaaI family thioesterase [Janthinobacterium lividum]